MNAPSHVGREQKLQESFQEGLTTAWASLTFNPQRKAVSLLSFCRAFQSFTNFLIKTQKHCFDFGITFLKEVMEGEDGMVRKTSEARLTEVGYSSPQRHSESI